jgi:Cu2+-containing amine oxidase
VVSLTQDKLVSRRDIDPAAEGQPPIMIEESALVDDIVKADPGWRAAMARRGITDLSLACPCPLSAGSFDLPGERAGGCYGCSPSSSTVPRTTRGRTPWTASSPTST